MATPNESPERSSLSEPSDTREFAGAVHVQPPSAVRAQRRVPDAIERRYLKVDNRYFFPDRTLAFIDDGNRIRVRTENPEVIHSVVAIAQLRGWRTIQVRGSKPFRQATWSQAALQGMEVRGYRPGELEVQQVARERERRLARGSTAPMAPPGSGQPLKATAPLDSPGRPGGAGSEDAGRADDRTRRDGPRPPIQGTLVAFAAAPYRFDPAQRMSFYVTLRTEVGDRTVWGVDLERALAQSASQPRVGDPVVLTQHGTNPVSVRIPARNHAGELTGEKKIVAQRARWRIETPEHLRDLQRQARMLRRPESLSEASLDRSPGLANAAAGVKLAEQYARRLTTDALSQDKLVQAIRDRLAAAMEQGQQIHLPKRKPPAPQRPARQRGGLGHEELAHERM